MMPDPVRRRGYFAFSTASALGTVSLGDANQQMPNRGVSAR